MSSTLILTSQKVHPGHLLRNRELVVLVDSKKYDEYLSHDERVDCLKKAVTEFDAELQTAAERFKDHPFGAYLWLYTPDFIRGEEISGLYRKMYLKAIINYLDTEKGFDKILIDTPLSAYEKNYLKKLPLKIAHNRIGILKNALLNLLQNAKQVYKTFSFNLKYIFKKSNPSFSGVLLDTSSSYAKNRYDDLDKVTGIFNNRVKFYSGDQIAVSGCPKEQTVVFKREMTINLFVLSLIKSFRISSFVSRNKSTIPGGLYYNHKGFFKLLLYWDLVLAQQSIAKYLDKSNIKTIVQVSTFTKPIYRYLAAAAKHRNITFIQVASRSLMRYRCSERLLQCDVEGYNQTAIPGWFIVKDKYSAKVFDPFPELKQRISIGGRFKSQQIELSNQDKPTAILLMFNHRKDLSYKLLNEVIKSDAHKLTNDIIMRCHPNFIFPEGLIVETFPKNKIIDITGRDYSVLANYRTLCLSGPTTGTLDAIKYGALIVWVPFIWGDGILMDDLMQQVGVLCNDTSDICRQVEKFVTNSEEFNNQMSNDVKFITVKFESEHLISDKLNELFIKSN